MIYKSKGSWPEYTKNSLLTSKKKDNPTEKRERNVNKIFYEKGYTNYQKTLKRCSTSVLTRKMLIKPQLNTYLTWLNLKTLILPCVGEYEKQMKLFHCWWECQLVPLLWKHILLLHIHLKKSNSYPVTRHILRIIMYIYSTKDTS